MVLTKKHVLPIVGGLVIIVAAGWFGWDFFADSAPPPKAPVAKSGVQPAAKQIKPVPPSAPVASAPAVPAPATPTPAAQTASAPAPAPETSGSSQAAGRALASRSATRARSRAGEDARGCLALTSNAEVHKCAEQYR